MITTCQRRAGRRRARGMPTRSVSPGIALPRMTVSPLGPLFCDGIRTVLFIRNHRDAPCRYACPCRKGTPLAANPQNSPGIVRKGTRALWIKNDLPARRAVQDERDATHGPTLKRAALRDTRRVRPRLTLYAKEETRKETQALAYRCEEDIRSRDLAPDRAHGSLHARRHGHAPSALQHYRAASPCPRSREGERAREGSPVSSDLRCLCPHRARALGVCCGLFRAGARTASLRATRTVSAKGRTLTRVLKVSLSGGRGAPGSDDRLGIPQWQTRECASSELPRSPFFSEARSASSSWSLQ